jgi:hypothetical protein
MSVTYSVPREDGVVFTAVGQMCFYCYETIHEDPAVHWMGSTGNIYLHPPCMTRLAVRLFRDVHETECPEHYRRLRGG